MRIKIQKAFISQLIIKAKKLDINAFTQTSLFLKALILLIKAWKNVSNKFIKTSIANAGFVFFESIQVKNSKKTMIA